MNPADQKELQLRIVTAQGHYLKETLDNALEVLMGCSLTFGVPVQKAIEAQNERRSNLNARLAAIEREVATAHRQELRQRSQEDEGTRKAPEDSSAQ